MLFWGHTYGSSSLPSMILFIFHVIVLKNAYCTQNDAFSCTLVWFNAIWFICCPVICLSVHLKCSCILLFDRDARGMTPFMLAVSGRAYPAAITVLEAAQKMAKGELINHLCAYCCKLICHLKGGCYVCKSLLKCQLCLPRACRNVFLTQREWWKKWGLCDWRANTSVNKFSEIGILFENLMSF